MCERIPFLLKVFFRQEHFLFAQIVRINVRGAAMKRLFFLSFSFFFLFPFYSKEKNYPQWLVTPPASEQLIYATGIAANKTKQIAITTAANLARSELSRVIAVRILSRMERMETEVERTFVDEQKFPSPSSREFVEVVSQQISKSVLEAAKIEEIYTDRSSSPPTYYVLVSMDKKHLQSSFSLINEGKEDSFLEAVSWLDTSPIAAVKESSVASTAVKANKRLKGERVSTGKKPRWVQEYPVEPGYYTGIGEGDTLQTAQDRAIAMIASQIHVKIKSENVSVLSEKNGIKDDAFSEVIQLSLMKELEDLEFMGAYCSSQQVYSTYYRLDRERYWKKQAERQRGAVRQAEELYWEAQDQKEATRVLKYLLLAYQKIVPYRGEGLMVMVDGKERFLQTLLFTELQDCLSSITIEPVRLPSTVSVLAGSMQEIELKILYAGNPVCYFPLEIGQKSETLEMALQGTTDDKGNVLFLVDPGKQSGKKAFTVCPNLISLLRDSAEEETSFLISSLSSLTLPEYKVNLELTAPSICLRMKLSASEEDLVAEKRLSAGIKQVFEKKIGAMFTNSTSSADHLLSFDFDIQTTVSPISGQYFTKLTVTGTLVAAETGKELFSVSLPVVKGGSVDGPRSFQKAVDKFLTDGCEALAMELEKRF